MTINKIIDQVMFYEHKNEAQYKEIYNISLKLLRKIIEEKIAEVRETKTSLIIKWNSHIQFVENNDGQFDAHAFYNTCFDVHSDNIENNVTIIKRLIRFYNSKVDTKIDLPRDIFALGEE